MAAEADPPAGRAAGQAACVAEPLGGALGPVGDVPARGVERADGAGRDRFHLGEVAVEGDDRVGVGERGGVRRGQHVQRLLQTVQHENN